MGCSKGSCFKETSALLENAKVDILPKIFAKKKLCSLIDNASSKPLDWQSKMSCENCIQMSTMLANHVDGMEEQVVEKMRQKCSGKEKKCQKNIKTNVSKIFRSLISYFRSLTLPLCKSLFKVCSK